MNHSNLFIKSYLLSSIIIVTMSLSSCSQWNCNDVHCSPEPPCEDAMQFDFKMDSITGFKLSDIDTIKVIRYLANDTNQTDSLELFWYIHSSRYGSYQATESSPIKEDIFWCDWLNSPGIVINNEAPFADSKYDNWNYDIILKNKRRIQLRNLKEIGKISDGCCGGYFSEVKEVDVDGVHHEDARFVTLN